MTEPDYACAVLRNAYGDFLLQLRPAGAPIAASQLTCFGGRREAGETAALCLARELYEELGWQVTTIPGPCVYLRDGQHLIASFHPLLIPADLALRSEPGFSAVYAPPVCLPGLPLSPWHHLVLTALLSARILPITVFVDVPRSPDPDYRR